MALVTFNKKDLEFLIGKKLSESDYKDKLIMMGVPLERYTDEEVDFEVFPNRPDMLSVEGFARAAAGFLGLKTRPPEYDVKKSNFVANVDKQLLGLRGCAGFAVIKDLKFTDESIAAFMQLQEKLSTTIGRKRKKASIGTYDLTDLRFPIKLTTISKIAKFVPLGYTTEMSAERVVKEHPKGQEYGHLIEKWLEYPAYLDAKNRVMSLLPIINSEFSKITPQTKNMLVEVTGTDWKAVREMLNIIVCALADRGAKIYEVRTVYPSNKVIRMPDLRPRRVKFDIDYANKLLDLDLKPPEVKERLLKMGFSFAGNDILVPPYRTDIMHPLDLVEDIAIAHGYEKFEPRIPQIPTIARPNDREEWANLLRSIMIGLGFQEIVTFVLSNEKDEFEKIRRQPIEHVQIQNPKTVDYTIARTSLIPSALRAFAQNQSREMPHRIFEIGNTIQIDKHSETGARDVPKLIAGLSHASAGYSEIKAALGAFFRNIGKKFEIAETSDAAFIEGRIAEIRIGGERAGVIGEIHPEVLGNFNIEYPIALFELSVDKIK